MVYVQLILLAGLFILSLSGQGLSHILIASVPFIISAALLYITVRLFGSIMKMLIDPNLIPTRDSHMHGSALPVLVFAPTN